MRPLAMDTEDHRQPLSVLAELCDIKVGNTRPLCNLASFHLIQFLSFFGSVLKIHEFAVCNIIDRYAEKICGGNKN